MAKLSYAARKRLPASDFVFPKTRSYPIENKSHARAALQESAGARSGKPASPEKRAKIREAVHRKFPSIGKPKQKLVSLSTLRRPR